MEQIITLTIAASAANAAWASVWVNAMVVIVAVLVPPAMYLVGRMEAGMERRHRLRGHCLVANTALTTIERLRDWLTAAQTRAAGDAPPPDFDWDREITLSLELVRRQLMHPVDSAGMQWALTEVEHMLAQILERMRMVKGVRLESAFTNPIAANIAVDLQAALALDDERRASVRAFTDIFRK